MVCVNGKLFQPSGCFNESFNESFFMLYMFFRSVSVPRLKGMPAAVLRGCGALATLGLHGNPVTLEQLRESDGFAEFNARRCAKHDKQVSFLILFAHFPIYPAIGSYV